MLRSNEENKSVSQSQSHQNFDSKLLKFNVKSESTGITFNRSAKNANISDIDSEGKQESIRQ